MELFLGLTEQTIHNPSAVEIAEAFLQDEQFLILSAVPDSLTYIQFHWTERTLEYQDASIERHFRATDDSIISMEQIIAAFQKYARGDDSWRDDFQWLHQAIG